MLAWGGQDPAGPDPRAIRGSDLVTFWVGGTIFDEEDPSALYRPGRAWIEYQRLFPANPPRYPRAAYPPPVYQAFAALQPQLSYLAVARAVPFGIAAAFLAGVALVVHAVRGLDRWRPEALAAGFLLPASLSHLLAGQLAGVWVLATGLGLWLRSRGRPGAAGLALSALWLKPPLGVSVALACLLLGEGRALAGMLAGGAAIGGLSVAVDGIDPWLAWIERMRDAEALTGQFWIQEPRQVTLRALAAPWAPPAVASAIGAAVGLALAGWAALPIPRGDHGLADLRAGAVLSACVLASPHLFDYDLGLHALGLAASLGWILERRAAWPSLGRVALALGWLSGALVLANYLLPVNVAALAALGWVAWMGAEVRRAGRAVGGYPRGPSEGR